MLQELKAPEERFLQSALCDLGYPSICENGGAIFDHGSGGIVLLRAA